MQTSVPNNNQASKKEVHEPKHKDEEADKYMRKRTRMGDILRAQQTFHKMRTKKKSALFEIGDDSDDNSVHNKDDNSGDSGFFDHLSDDLSEEIVAFKRPAPKMQPMVTYGYKTIDDF